ncbi:DUF721 domain-containing protein [bacterium]|nr:DUF721 domain-containing protein [bacterium]QQR56911.1 MAG: DUF721 domain-containing protein [Candidatus Melainabacteria bacterium]
MTNRRKKSNFTNLSDVLGPLVAEIKLDQRLREHSLFSLWPYIVGENLSRLSRPVFFDHQGVMVVACSDASCAQELSLKKMQIQDQLYKAGRGMNVKVSGLRFDIKLARYVKDENVPDPVIEASKLLAIPEFTEIEREVDLKPEDLRELETLKTALINDDGIDPKMIDRILMVHKRELNLREWYRQKGCPSCPSCGLPVARLHWEAGVCGNCYIQSVR